MPSKQDYSEPIERIVEAENSRDADQVAALVAEDYRSETPSHSARNFTGRERADRTGGQSAGIRRASARS